MEDANPTIQDLTRIYDKLGILTTRELTKASIDLALAQNTNIYDALYIVAAQKINATLYTADQKLHNTAKKTANTQLLKP